MVVVVSDINGVAAAAGERARRDRHRQAAVAEIVAVIVVKASVVTAGQIVAVVGGEVVVLVVSVHRLGEGSSGIRRARGGRQREVGGISRLHIDCDGAIHRMAVVVPHVDGVAAGRRVRRDCDRHNPVVIHVVAVVGVVGAAIKALVHVSELAAGEIPIHVIGPGCDRKSAACGRRVSRRC